MREGGEGEEREGGGWPAGEKHGRLNIFEITMGSHCSLGIYSL